jgi:ATP-binding cassette subfamily B (MDR/TAP) protein 1
VTFSYPKDKNRTILKNFSAVFDNNQGALVGESGCGKSTVLQLIMRYYDPDEGKVTLDGHDLRDLDLGWLRHNIGYVGQ